MGLATFLGMRSWILACVISVWSLHTSIAQGLSHNKIEASRIRAENCRQLVEALDRTLATIHIQSAEPKADTLLSKFEKKWRKSGDKNPLTVSTFTFDAQNAGELHTRLTELRDQLKDPKKSESLSIERFGLKADSEYAESYLILPVGMGMTGPFLGLFGSAAGIAAAGRTSLTALWSIVPACSVLGCAAGFALGKVLQRMLIKRLIGKDIGRWSNWRLNTDIHHFRDVAESLNTHLNTEGFAYSFDPAARYFKNRKIRSPVHLFFFKEAVTGDVNPFVVSNIVPEPKGMREIISEKEDAAALKLSKIFRGSGSLTRFEKGAPATYNFKLINNSPLENAFSWSKLTPYYTSSEIHPRSRLVRVSTENWLNIENAVETRKYLPNFDPRLLPDYPQ